MSKNVVAEYEKFSAGDLTLKKKSTCFPRTALPFSPAHHVYSVSTHVGSSLQVHVAISVPVLLGACSRLRLVSKYKQSVIDPTGLLIILLVAAKCWQVSNFRKPVIFCMHKI